MHKLCTLKDIVPGSVIELPEAYQSKAGETAIVLGLEYASDKQKIRAELLRNEATGLVHTALPSMDENTTLAITQDRVLETAVVRDFVAHKVALPAMGMSMGCDPEVFVLHGDGTIFPAWEYMPTEDEAQAMAKEWLNKKWGYEKNGTVWSADGREWNSHQSIVCPQKVPAYWDGAQAEFAPWAKGCLETLHYGTREGLKATLDFARLKDPSAKLTLRNVIELPEATLKTADDRFIQFRCSQSYNIYNDPGDGIPDARQYKYRCSGGHIHIGYTKAFTAPAIEQIVRGLDGVLGVIGVSLAAGIDDPERRRTYGRAGEFRLPSHGLEYRVLSNFWLSHPAIAMLVFEVARAAVRLAESGLFNLCWAAREAETREVINMCDVNGARRILERNTPVLLGMLNGIWQPQQGCRTEQDSERMRALAFKTIMTGISEAIETPFDIETNWKLDAAKWQYHCRGEGDSWKSLAALRKA